MPNDEFGAGLGTALAVPVIAGGVASYRSAASAGVFSAFGQPVTPAIPAATAVREFAEQYMHEDPGYPLRQTFRKRWQTQGLRDLADVTHLAADDVREALLRASRLADPTGILTEHLNTRLSFAATGSEALRDVATIMESQSSVYAQRAVDIFMDDVGILEERAEQGLGTKPTTWAGRVKRDIRPLQAGVLDEIMQADIARLKQLTGAEIDITHVSRAGKPRGAELHLRFKGMSGVTGPAGRPGDFTLRIPRPLKDRPGVIVRGTTQQSRYIAGMYGVVEEGILKESFNHEQWMLRRATEDLIPEMMRNKRLTQRSARKMVSDFERLMMEAPEWIPSIEEGVHPGLDEYTKMREQVIRLSAAGDMPGSVRPLTEFEYAGLMERGGAAEPSGMIRPLYPGYSPTQIAKGVASTVDVRGGLSMVPEAVPYGRRPLQYLRAGFAPTKEALVAMAADPINQRFGWAKASVGIDAPMTRAAYVSSSLGPELAGTGVTAEGQLLVSNRLANQRAVKQWHQFDIASSELVDLADVIGKQTGSDWTINRTLPAGTLLGYGPDGRPVVLPSQMNITQATAFAKDKAKGDFIRVMGMSEVDRMRYAKVFGGAKGMAVEVSPEYIEKVLTKHAGLAQAKADIYQGIDAVITMDELKKNRGLHYNQMFTALWDFSKHNMQSGLTQGSSFVTDPHSAIAQIRRAATTADKFSHEAALGQIMGLAREANLDPRQMGQVFGAVPEVFGNLEALGPLSAAEAAEVRRGVATGATQLFFEGLGGPGAGRTATIEPRMFELLGAPHFGAVGPEIQAEVAQRMIAAHPERFAEQREITKSLETVMGLGKRQGAMGAKGILAGLGDAMLPQKATTLGIPGIGDIYIPSERLVSQMAEYQTAAGGTVLSPLGHAYRDVLEGAQQYEARNITEDVMRKHIANLQNELAVARVGTITGAGGVLRNRLPGSVFLTAVQPTLGEKLPYGTVGITENYAKQVFGEMRRLGLYGSTELDVMQKRFMAGEQVAGLLGRHPYIGPYSTQAVQFQKIAGTEAIAMIGEREMRAVAYQGQLQGEALTAAKLGTHRAFRENKDIARRLNQLGAERLGSPIRLSPFVGLAGDVDGDVMSAMFAGPQLEKSLTSHIMDTDALVAYEEYAIRSQVLKGKAAGDVITMRKAMAGDVLKLGVTEGGRLGRLSVGLQQHRAAILAGAGSLTATERMDALGLLEWMEQTPISAKHIKPGEEARLVHLLDDIQDAMDKKSAGGIADAARRVLGEAKVAGYATMRDGFTIAMEDIGTGDVATRFIKSVDIEKSAKNIMKATNAFESTSVGRTSAAKVREMIMGRAGYSTGREAAELMKAEVLTQSPFGTLFSQMDPPTGFGELAQRASALTNKIGAAGRSMLAHARPLALGTAAGLGLAAVLSEPPRVLPPGANAAPTGIIKTNTGGANIDTDVHPESHVRGAPTAPGMSRGSAPVAARGETGYRVNIRGTTAQDLDQLDLAEQLRRGVGHRARVNSTIRDQRTSLTSQKLSSILRGD